MINLRHSQMLPILFKQKATCKTLALTCWPGKLLHTTCVRAAGSFDFYQDATASMKTLARKKEWEFPTHPFIDKNFAPLSLDETNQNVWI